MRSRWYAPRTHRFLSPDRLGVAAGINQFAFAGGDPVNGVDPFGTCNFDFQNQVDLVQPDGTVTSSWCASGPVAPSTVSRC